MKKISLVSKATISVIFCFIAIFAMLVLYHQHKLLPIHLYNADDNYYLLFLRGVFVQHIPFHTWYPSTGLGYFPDMFLLLICMILTNWHVLHADLLYFFLQSLIYFSVLSYFYTIFCDKKTSLILASASMIVLFSTNIFFGLFLYGDHSTTLIIALLLIAIIAKGLVNQYAIRDVLIIFLLTSLTLISDSILLLWFIFPLMSAITYLWLTRRLAPAYYLFWVILVVLICVACLFRPYLAPHPVDYHPFLSLSRLSLNLHYISFELKIVSNLIAMIVSGCSTLILLVIFIVVEYLARYRLKKQDATLIFILVFTLSLTAGLLVSWLLVAPSKPSMRYLTIWLILPNLTLTIILFSFLKELWRNTMLNCLFFILIVLSLLFVTRIIYPSGQDKYNVQTAKIIRKNFTCIYNTLQTWNLQRGLAGYWNAKPLILHAPKNHKLTLATYSGSQPYNWLTTSTWYYPSYSFLIINTQVSQRLMSRYQLFIPTKNALGSLRHKQYIIGINGHPTHTSHCGIYDVLIYPQNGLYASYAAKLEDIGEVSIPLTMAASSLVFNGAKARSPTFGPIGLPAGQYKILVQYSAQQAIGNWFDIIYNGRGDQSLKFILSETKGKRKIVKGFFTVPKKNKGGQLEFRAHYSGRGMLTVYSIKLKLLDKR